jgi:hypothetical protein
MAMLIVGFVAMLMMTFVVVIALTRRAPHEETIARRMASIDNASEKGAGATTEKGQLLKATRTGRFGWLDRVLEPYALAQELRMRILQANSSTTVGTMLLSSLGLFIAGSPWC